MKRYLPIILLIIFPLFGHAAKTTYGDDGVYESLSRTRVNASQQRADTVLNKFIYDLTHDPESLFDNIFEGLGKQEGGLDILIIEYCGYSHDPKRDVYIGTIDILLGSIRLFGIDFAGRITQKRTEGKRTEVCFDLVDSNSVMKLASGKIIVTRVDDQTVEIRQTARIKFTRFFDFFFTQSTYKKVADWRLDKFLMNLKREMEKQDE